MFAPVTKSAKPNAQYNLSAPNSPSMRAATRMRAQMFHLFMRALKTRPHDRVLDIGVTSDQTYRSSNYFEDLYPFKHKLTAAGLDDAAFLENRHPGLRFVRANALNLPFSNESFDLIHS